MKRDQKKKNKKSPAEIEQDKVNAKIVIIVPDEKKFCATRGDHINLQESPAGFGDTEVKALEDLFKEEQKKKIIKS